MIYLYNREFQPTHLLPR